MDHATLPYITLPLRKDVKELQLLRSPDFIGHVTVYPLSYKLFHRVLPLPPCGRFTSILVFLRLFVFEIRTCMERNFAP